MEAAEQPADAAGAAAPDGSEPVEAWTGNDPVLVAALEAFDLKSGASENDLRKQFHRAALKWHPDKNKTQEAVKKFQEISDAYTLLTERQLSGSGAAATATVTVVTAPGKWHELAAALDDVALNSDRSALLVDGSGDARVFLEQISRAPIMPVESGGSIKRDLFGQEMRNIAKSQLTDSSFFLGTLVDSMAAGKPFVVDLSQPQQNTKVDLSGNVLLAKLRFLLDGVRREVLAGLKSAAGQAEELTESFKELAVKREERAVPRAEQEAEAAKDRALLAMLTGERDADGNWSPEVAAAIAEREAAEKTLASQKQKAQDARQERVDKMAADKAAKEAEAWHTQKAKSLAKEKPKKPKKGPDSSMLCFNLEMRAQLLKENPGMASRDLGMELRKRWSALSFDEQQSVWGAKAEANVAKHKAEMEEYEAALAAYNDKDASLAQEAPKSQSGPKVTPEFLRQNFKPWLMQEDGLFTSLMNKTLHRAGQHRPLFVAAGRAEELERLSEETLMKWSFIILCKVADVPQELERRMTEVRTVVSSAHVTDRERAMGQLEREVKHAFDNADALSGSVAAAVAAGDDERDYHLKQGA